MLRKTKKRIVLYWQVALMRSTRAWGAKDGVFFKGKIQERRR
jgi:hypothetical protein